MRAGFEIAIAHAGARQTIARGGAAVSARGRARPGGEDGRGTDNALRQTIQQNRRRVCQTCDEWTGSYCELRFPRGACLVTLYGWLAAPQSACPHPSGSRWELDEGCRQAMATAHRG